MAFRPPSRDQPCLGIRPDTDLITLVSTEDHQIPGGLPPSTTGRDSKVMSTDIAFSSAPSAGCSKFVKKTYTSVGVSGGFKPKYS